MQNFIEKPTSKLKKAWEKQRGHGLKNKAWRKPAEKNNSKKKKKKKKKAYHLVKDLTSSKQGRTTTIQDKAGKCLTEEQDILNRRTEYCSELYTHTTTGDPMVLDAPPPINNDSCPILWEEVEAAVHHRRKASRQEWTTFHRTWSRQEERPWQMCYSSSAIRSDRQESGQHLGLSPWSSLSQRKTTYNYAKTTVPSAWSVI